MVVFLSDTGSMINVKYNYYKDKSEFWRVVFENKFSKMKNSSPNAIQVLKSEVDTIYNNQLHKSSMNK